MAHGLGTILTGWIITRWYGSTATIYDTENRYGFSLTGTITNGSPIITAVSSVAGIGTGMSVVGSQIPASATVSSVDSATQITISSNATGNGTSFSLNVIAAASPTQDPSTYLYLTASNGVTVDIYVM